MAQGDTPITLVGNIVADPELRYTQSGSAVASFRVASTPRRYDQQSGQWVDGEALFLTCNIWRQAAENVANSLTKGTRVVLTGRLQQRSYETREGEKRSVFEVEVEDIGPSLKFATAQVTRAARGGSQGGGGFGGGFGGGQGAPTGGATGGAAGGQRSYGGGGAGAGGNGPRNQGFGGRNAAPDNDPWNSAPQSGFDAGDDEPPF